MRCSLPLLALLAAAPALAQPFTIESPDPRGESYFGSAIAAVPDANGDGYGDFLVGSPHESLGEGLQEAGRAYLFSGATGGILLTLSSPHPTASGEFGNVVAGVEDADGDGRGDLLVSAPREDTPEGYNFRGLVHLFSGATGAFLLTLESPDPELGPHAGDFGWSVSGVADADGDGRGDLLVGAFAEDGGATDAGRAYLFSGATGHLLHAMESPAPEESGFFGLTVAGVEDVNGDDRGDLLVGAGESVGGILWAGRVYVFDGATSQLLHTFVSPNPGGCSFCRRSFGVVAGVEDADGDGRGDILVGAEFEDGGGLNEAGRAYLYSGATGTLLRTLVSPSAQVEGHFGGSVSGVPDVDGDGRGDLGVGAGGEGYFHGSAYVFSGRTGERLFTLRSPNPEALGYFGNAGAGLGDVNGDGRGDGVVAAPSETVGGMENAGRVYLYRTGGPDGAWVGAEGVTTADEPESAPPVALALSAAPNPLALSTAIRVGLPRPAGVTLEVLDVLGRRVALLHEGALAAGTHALRWEPSAGLRGGVYLVRLRVAGEPARTQRLTLAR